MARILDLTSLMGAYGPRLYGFCKRFGIAPEDAREVIQETFIRVWEHRHEIRPDTSFSSYLFTIARNLIYNSLRHAAYWDKYLGEAGLQTAGSTVAPTADERELQGPTHQEAHVKSSNNGVEDSFTQSDKTALDRINCCTRPWLLFPRTKRAHGRRGLAR